MKRALSRQIVDRLDRDEPLAPRNALAILEHAIARSVNGNSVPELLTILVEHAAELCNASLTVAALYTGDKERLRVTATNSAHMPTGAEFASFEALDEWCLRQSRALHTLPQYQNFPPIADNIHSFSLHQALAARGQTLGILGVYGPEAYSAEAQRWLALLVGQFASTLDAMQLSEQLQAQQKLLEHAAQVRTALHQVEALVARADTHHVGATELLQIVHSLVPFDSGVLYMHERTTQFGMLSANRAGQPSEIPGDAPVMRFQTLPLLHEILIVRQPIFLDDVKQSSRWRPHLPEHAVGSWAGMPLVYGDKVVGLLFLGSDQTNFFTSLHRQCLELFRGVFAIWMHALLLEKRKDRERAKYSELSRQVITAQEEERKHVSRELHDEAGQSLTALTINLELLQQDLNGQSQVLIERARESVRMTQQTLQGIRSVVRRLRPPALELLGLDGALEQLCADVRRRTGLEIVLNSDPIEGVSDAVSLTLYRCVQEALTNVNKHAMATRVQVQVVRTKQEILVTIQDDGVGFDQKEQLKGPRPAGRLGLLGMKERLALVHGHLTIESGPGEGTVVIAEIPIGSKSGS